MTNKNKKVVVRIAPSPTGALHVGTARTALFNYLFAKHYRGKFILRIEDTDKERSEQTKQKQAPRHICSYRNKDATKKNLKDAIIRFKNDTKDTLKFNDLIRDEIKFESENFGDFSIAKSLTEPLYNFAVVIDDYQMKVTHIIRGEDHIPNTPRQILLQQALGMPMPKYAHLPLILGSDKSKLSKRHGATSVTEYKKLGYLPDALFNFLAILGWRGKNDEKEILDRKEIIQEFLLEDVQKSGAIFDVEKLNWMNGEYIRKISLKELTQLSIPYLTEAGYLDGIKRNTLQKIQKIIALEQTRMKKLLDIVDTADI